jgi:hypothetical protein
MKLYGNKIALTNNSRGVWSLDTSLGCSSGTKDNKKGCYNDCYAVKSAQKYGYDFTKTVFRYFTSGAHKNRIVNQIKKINLPFVRIGTMGDPSENWAHTLDVIKVISRANKEIVIITKHWTTLTDEQLIEISKHNVCINTSVSALDDPEHLLQSVNEFLRVKPFCKSVLRIVSADFNLDNETGHKLFKVQTDLFKQAPTLDTVLRVSKNNPLVTSGVINIKRVNFLGKKQWASKYNKKTYLGKCSTCSEMCGQSLKYSEVRPFRIQNEQLKISTL